MRELRPLYDQVFVKRDEPKAMTESGLYIPEGVQAKAQTGTVVAVGDGRTTKGGTKIPMELKVGDRIYIGERRAEPVKIDGEELFVLRERDVFVVIEESAPSK